MPKNCPDYSVTIDEQLIYLTYKAGDTLSSRHVSSHKTYVLFSTPSLSLPMRWLPYADLYNLMTWCHKKVR